MLLRGGEDLYGSLVFILAYNFILSSSSFKGQMNRVEVIELVLLAIAAAQGFLFFSQAVLGL